MLYIMGAATGMPARTAGSGAGMPASTVGSRTGAGMLGITATGAGMPAKTAGSGLGMPARTVGSRTVGVEGTGGRGKLEGVMVAKGSGVGEVAIISVGVSERLGEATVPTSGGGPSAVPNIGTSGCRGWLGIPVTTVGVAVIMGVAAMVGVSGTLLAGAGAGGVGGT